MRNRLMKKDTKKKQNSYLRRRTPRCFCDVVGCCCSFSFRGFSYPWLFDVILHPFVSYRQVYPYRHLPILYFQLSSSQSDSRHFQTRPPPPFFRLHSFPTFLAQFCDSDASRNTPFQFLLYACSHRVELHG